MERRNQTIATEIVLLGFSKDKKTNAALFVLFFIIYIITYFENVCMICIILLSTHLHTPMYFFLCNLSFVDLFFSSTVLPKLLVDLFSIPITVSLTACALQLYFSLYLGATECLLLAVMAYDRYVAICRPLYYALLMSWNTCYLLTIITWLSSFIVIVFSVQYITVPLCNPNQVNHFMCEVLTLVRLACGNINIYKLTTLSVCLLLLLLPFVFILMSYICIIASVLQIDSVGRVKTFSTCSSHLMVVVLYYGTALLMYAVPSSYYLRNKEKYFSFIFVVGTPMLKPLIYSLNNREFKKNLQKIFAITICPHVQ